MIKTTKIRKTFKTKEKIYLHKPLFVKCIKHFKGLVADLLEFAFTVQACEEAIVNLHTSLTNDDAGYSVRY